jgi:NADPH-dependent 2,4-dienoyl-CoA reductase/sulfur reductase-like enzyme
VSPRDPGRVVIVGGGLAGFSAAESLRSRGFGGTITVIDAEPALYDRPPLSKELFDPELSLDRLAFAAPARLAELDLEVITGRTVTAIDPGSPAVVLDDGTVLPAGTVLLTTGGRARRLPVPGGDLPAVHVLRSFSDAIGLRDAVTSGSRVLVVGAGLIGAEVASALLAAGAQVTLVDPVETPLVPAVGELLAGHLHAMHGERGIDVRLGGLTAVEQTDGGVVAVLSDGSRIDTDVVVVGAGLVPNVELATEAGLDVDNGILVDADHRTSAPGIYAAGDVARMRGESGVLERREEHWEAAQLAGREAAAGILGLPAEPRGAAWFWSDRHGSHVEVVGRLMGDGTLVVRDGAEHPAVFLVENGFLVGAASIDDSTTVRAARRLIDQRVPITEAELADPAVSLRNLLKASR